MSSLPLLQLYPELDLGLPCVTWQSEGDAISTMVCLANSTLQHADTQGCRFFPCAHLKPQDASRSFKIYLLSVTAGQPSISTTVAS
eukprot:355739-Chlamydomonas_euryale.AAC.6